MSAIGSRWRSIARGLVIILVSFVLGGIPLASALHVPSVKVTAADDGAGPGTCPSTNEWGAPTNGNCFKPDTIAVKTGDHIKWTNTGQRPHDIVADDGSFRSPMLDPGDSWSFTFQSAGTFQYYCSLHGDKGGSGQAGKVIVSSVRPAASGDKRTASASSRGTPTAAAVSPATRSRAAGLVPTAISVKVKSASIRKPDAQGEMHDDISSGGFFLIGLAVSAISGLLLWLAAQRRRAGPREETP